MQKCRKFITFFHFELVIDNHHLLSWNVKFLRPFLATLDQTRLTYFDMTYLDQWASEQHPKTNRHLGVIMLFFFIKNLWYSCFYIKCCRQQILMFKFQCFKRTKNSIFGCYMLDEKGKWNLQSVYSWTWNCYPCNLRAVIYQSTKTFQALKYWY